MPDLSFQPKISFPNPIEKSVTPTPYLLAKYNEEDRQKLFVLKPLYQRALIVFGGPLANFLTQSFFVLYLTQVFHL